MNSQSKHKFFSASLSLALIASVLSSSAARAYEVTCRDYYANYLAAATNPAPPPPLPGGIIIIERPHFHGHYARYHGHYDGGYHGGGGHYGGDYDSEAQAVLVLGLLTTAGLAITTTIEDAQLNDAKNVLADINEAQMGDGIHLRNFAQKVQSHSIAAYTTLPQIAAALTRANQNLEFCRMGDLDTESELAIRIANNLAAGR